MKKLILLGALVFSSVLFASAQACYAWTNVNMGCTASACHASSDLHSNSNHTPCAACHTGTPGLGNVTSGKCAGCHPIGSPGKCNLVNSTKHAIVSPSCISCHSYCATSTTTTIPSGAFCTDNDKDTYGDNCTAGPDCDDSDNTTHEGCGCIDDDGDGYGDNCTLGPDCDDSDNTTHEGCEIDCTLTIRPKTFTVLRAVLSPLQFFIIRADRNSSISFSNPICIFWGSEGIDDRVKIRIGEKMIIGYIQVYPTHLTAGDFNVYVTFGDIKETQCGPIEVR